MQEKRKSEWERDCSRVTEHSVDSLALLREKPHHRQILDFSKALSFSEAGLPEVLFRILTFVPITTEIQILSVWALMKPDL